jgi:quercetin dioxygenase-like cupin family protein
VLQGHLRYNLGEEEYELETGDTLFYRDDVAHSWINIGLTTALVLTVSALNGRDDR